MRKLASVQLISLISPIAGADRIEVARVCGWNVVVKKGEFSVGDKCVYIEIDSLLPEDNSEFDFLKDSKGHIKRLKTVKLRGQISQGICFPMSLLDKDYEVDTDVTEILHIKKWEPDQYNRPSNGKTIQRTVRRFHGRLAKWLYKHKLPEFLRPVFYTIGRLPFPSFINKTDETRVQVMQNVLDFYKDTPCVVTEKVDGSSITIWFDDKCKMHVASRNYELLNIDGDKGLRPFVTAAKEVEHQLKSALPDSRLRNLCLQGELVGPNIQGNKYHFDSKRVYFYNLFNIATQEYMSQGWLRTLCCDAGLNVVPEVDTNYILSNNIDEIVNMSVASSKLYNTPREGIVIRPIDVIVDTNGFGSMVGNRVSFKAINPEFLLKWGL